MFNYVVLNTLKFIHLKGYVSSHFWQKAKEKLHKLFRFMRNIYFPLVRIKFSIRIKIGWICSNCQIFASKFNFSAFGPSFLPITSLIMHSVLGCEKCNCAREVRILPKLIMFLNLNSTFWKFLWYLSFSRVPKFVIALNAHHKLSLPKNLEYIPDLILCSQWENWISSVIRKITLG